MSIAATFCPACGTAGIQGAKFCGKCGSQIQSGNSQPAAPQSGAPQSSATQPAAAHPHNFQQHAVASQTGDWKGMAALACGVLSIFMCGAIASVPGIIFGWMDLKAAIAAGRSTGMAKLAIGLSVAGIVLTIFGGLIIGLMLMMGGGQPQYDPMMYDPTMF